jgi:hypothetical protein
MTMLNNTSVKWRLRIGQSASRTVVNGEMSLRRLKLSIYEAVTPREEEDGTVRRYVCTAFFSYTLILEDENGRFF